MDAKVQRIASMFTEEEKAFNREMVQKGLEVSSLVRNNLITDRLGGKVIRDNPDSGNLESDCDMVSEALKEYFGK